MRSSSPGFATTTGTLVDLVFGGVDPTWKTVTSASFTFDLHSPLGHLLAKGGVGLDVDRIPADRDKGFAIGHRIGSGYVRTPVPDGLLIGAPNTGLAGGSPWWVNIVTNFRVSK